MSAEPRTLPDEHRLRELRDKLAENDRFILKAIGARVALVKEIWELKRKLGMEIEDPDRERWLHTFLRRSPTGFHQLRPSTVDHVVDFLLDLTKDEAGG